MVNLYFTVLNIYSTVLNIYSTVLNIYSTVLNIYLIMLNIHFTVLDFALICAIILSSHLHSVHHSFVNLKMYLATSRRDVNKQYTKNAQTVRLTTLSVVRRLLENGCIRLHIRYY